MFSSLSAEDEADDVDLFPSEDLSPANPNSPHESPPTPKTSVRASNDTDENSQATLPLDSPDTNGSSCRPSLVQVLASVPPPPHPNLRSPTHQLPFAEPESHLATKSGDSTLAVLLCCTDGRIRPLDPRTGRELAEYVLPGAENIHSRRCCSRVVQLSDDGMAISSTSGSHFALRYSTGRPLHTFPHGRSTLGGRGHGIVFDCRESILYAGGHPGRIWAWNLDEDVVTLQKTYTLSPSHELWEGHAGIVSAMDLDFDHSPTHLITGSFDRVLKVWDTSRHDIPIFRSDRGTHEYPIRDFAHDTERDLQFASSGDCSVTLWDRKNWSQGPIFRFEGDITTGSIQAIAYRQAQSQLIVPRFTGIVDVYDIRVIGSSTLSQKSLFSWRAHHTSHVGGCIDLPELGLIVTAAFSDKTVQAWDLDGRGGDDPKKAWELDLCYPIPRGAFRAKRARFGVAGLGVFRSDFGVDEGWDSVAIEDERERIQFLLRMMERGNNAEGVEIRDRNGSIACSSRMWIGARLW